VTRLPGSQAGAPYTRAVARSRPPIEPAGHLAGRLKWQSPHRRSGGSSSGRGPWPWRLATGTFYLLMIAPGLRGRRKSPRTFGFGKPPRRWRSPRSSAGGRGTALWHWRRASQAALGTGQQPTATVNLDIGEKIQVQETGKTTAPHRVSYRGSMWTAAPRARRTCGGRANSTVVCGGEQLARARSPHQASEMEVAHPGPPKATQGETLWKSLSSSPSFAAILRHPHDQRFVPQTARPGVVRKNSASTTARFTTGALKFVGALHRSAWPTKHSLERKCHSTCRVRCASTRDNTQAAGRRDHLLSR